MRVRVRAKVRFGMGLVGQPGSFLGNRGLLRLTLPHLISSVLFKCHTKLCMLYCVGLVGW